VGFFSPHFAIDRRLTMAFVLRTVLGGRATLWGPVLGAVILEIAQQWFAYSFGGSKFYLIAYALVFLVVILLLPRGVVPSIEDWMRRRRRRQTVDTVEPAPAPNRSLATGSV
jgi:branched-chain amino acid transport system permease protein